MQFARQRDASKIGFAVLNCHLQRWGYVLNDGKYETSHLNQLGFKLVPRNAFNALLAKGCAEPGHQGGWSVDRSIDVASWDPAAMPTGLGRRRLYSTVAPGRSIALADRAGRGGCG